MPASPAPQTPSGWAHFRDERYEYREVTLPRHVTRAEARQLLTDEAEYGRWELARVTVYFGGARRIRLRRRTMTLQRGA